MCGRYSNSKTPQFLRNNPWVVAPDAGDIRPAFNVAPGQLLQAVVQEAVPTLRQLAWGFHSDGRPMINARAETVDRIALFRSCFQGRRCLLIADGFYEWRKEEGSRPQPWYFSLKSGEPFALAGIWKPAQEADGPGDCLVITTAPNGLVAPVHNRMPAIVPPEQYRPWLSGAAEEAKQWLRPYPEEAMQAYPVARLVNNVRNDSPDCIRPAAA